MSVIFRNVMLKRSVRLTVLGHCRGLSQGPSFDHVNVETVKAEFVRYEGGRIDLDKNEDSGIATITLRHEEKRNAISGKMMCQFSDIVTELEDWSVAGGKGRAVLLKSDDQDYFCSGADLTSTVRNISK